jgi:integrase
MTRRRRINSNLPINLYVSKKGPRYYYRYRNPETGKETGMGTDKQAAIKAAHELNARLFPAPVDLVARVIGGIHRVDGWLDRHLEIYTKRTVKGRPISEQSITSMKKLHKHIRQGLGTIDVARVTTQHIASFLDSFEGTPTTARQLRTALMDVFNEGVRQGVIQNNPVQVTRTPSVQVMRSRLSLDEFSIIFDAAGSLLPYVQNAMLLAITTGQRLDDISRMLFKDVSDGYLHVRQSKTGAMIRLSLQLRLDALGFTVGDVISRCRDIVVSPYLLHHIRNHPMAKKGGQIGKVTISHGFTKARGLSGLQWDHPPTFHEIRSLSGRLYKDQGMDAQALLGHKDARTYIRVPGQSRYRVDIGRLIRESFGKVSGILRYRLILQ